MQRPLCLTFFTLGAQDDLLESHGLPQTYTGLFVNDMNSPIGLKMKVLNSTREWKVVE